MNFSDSQYSSFDTPIPIQRQPVLSNKLEDSHTNLANTLIRILTTKGIQLNFDAALYVVKQSSTQDGKQINDHMLDQFYSAIEHSGICQVDIILAKQLLGRPLIEKECISVFNLCPAKLINCFDDMKREVWDLQHQKFIIDPIPPTLLPTVRTLQSATTERYYRAIQRIKSCPNIVWWSEAHLLGRITITGSDKILIRPVECAIGVTGNQTIVGILQTDQTYCGGSMPGRQWFIEDGLQRLQLNIDNCDLGDTLFLQSNIIVATGFIKPEESCFYANELAHPPFDEDTLPFDKDIKNKTSIRQSTLLGGGTTLNHHMSTHRFHPSRQRLLQMKTSQLSSESVVPEDLWLVFGLCHLNNGAVITNIYSAITECKRISGIILIGEFNSLSFDPQKKLEYQDGFKELLESLHMCLNNKECRIVFIPGPNDPGPRFLPKIPLLPTFLEPIQHELITNNQIVFGSNPLRIESVQNVPNPMSAYPDNVTTTFVIYRANLLRDIDALGLALSVPFQQPAFATTDELEKTIPPLIAGQGHLYPVPFSTAQSVKIAPGYDFTLHVSPLPNGIIYSDDAPPFVTFWENKCWFANPGNIARGEYLVVDLCSNQMMLRYVSEPVLT